MLSDKILGSEVQESRLMLVLMHVLPIDYVILCQQLGPYLPVSLKWLLAPSMSVGRCG